MISADRLSMLSSAFPVVATAPVTPSGTLARSLANITLIGTGSSNIPDVASDLRWVMAGPGDTTFTRLARKIDPNATTDQVAALAKANGYAATTAVKPGMIYFWTTDIFPEVK